MNKIYVAAIVVSGLLTGCGTDRYLKQTDSVDVVAAYQLTDREAVEEVDLGWLLIRYAPNVRENGLSCENVAVNVPAFAREVRDRDGHSEPSNAREEVERGKARLDRAGAYFNCRIDSATEAQRRSARNGLQERLLAASQQRCGAFAANLQRTFSRTNFGLGIATTIAGTAGALVNSVGAARSLAGAAGIFSGSRAEFNQDFMSNLAAHVIIDGIQKRRQAVYEQIQNRGQSMDYSAYPVEAAIKDALFYHGECSVVAGFQQASDSIKYANDPGLLSSIQTLAKVRAARGIWSAEELKPEEALSIAAKIGSSAPLVAGTALGGFNDDAGYLTGYQQALQQIAETDALMNADIASMRKKSIDAKGAAFADQLGLTETFKADGVAGNSFGSQCQTRVNSYFTNEVLARTNAGQEADLLQKRKLLAAAASARVEGAFLANRAAELASDYSAQSVKARGIWATQFTKAIAGETQAVLELNKFFKPGNLPAFNTDSLKILNSLCSIATSK